MRLFRSIGVSLVGTRYVTVDTRPNKFEQSFDEADAKDMKIRNDFENGNTVSEDPEGTFRQIRLKLHVALTSP